jgi:hypothetical protein
MDDILKKWQIKNYFGRKTFSHPYSINNLAATLPINILFTTLSIKKPALPSGNLREKTGTHQSSISHIANKDLETKTSSTQNP